MQNIRRQAISGYTLDNCRFEGIPEAEPMARFMGTAYYRGSAYANREILMGASILFTHVLVLGSSQSGKTNVIAQLATQLSARNNSVCVIFDTKGDYKKHSGIRRNGDIVLEAGYNCPAWNIFDEITADGMHDPAVNLLAREVAQALFRDQENSQNPFFHQAAAELFSAILRCMVYKSVMDPVAWRPRLNNHGLKQYILGVEQNELNDLFMECGNHLPDVRNIAQTYLGSKANLQGLGVIASLRLMVNRVFQGIFDMVPTTNNPSFSIIRLMRTMRHGNLFIEYDLQKGAVLAPVYSLLFDLAMKETLSPARSSTRSSEVFFILDELKLLPALTHLEDAINYGRSNRISVIAGLQNVHQLAGAYRDSRDQVILGSFGSLIAMRLNDVDSRRFVSQMCGTTLLLERTMGADYLPVEQQRMGNVVEDWDLQQLTIGQAIIKLSSQTMPFKFKFNKDPYAR